MKINDVVKETEDYLNGEISEHIKPLASMLLRELRKIESDDSYMVPSEVMRSIMDSFDFSTDYWKQCFSKYWNENLEKFENPYE